MGGVGAVLSIQADIADDVIGLAVTVEICCGDRVPPACPRGGKSRLLRPVLEPATMVIVEILHLTPLQSDQQVGPAVTIDVGPQR